MDILNRLWRHLRSMYYRMLCSFYGIKPVGGGEEPPVETPPVETPPVETPPVETPPVDAWHKPLGEEAGKDPEINCFKTMDEFVKAHGEKVKLISQKGVIVPGADATPEAKEKFLNDLGRPATPAEYKLDAVEGMHESIKITPETTAQFNGEMHKIGLSNDQANAINKMQMNFVNEAIKVQDAAEIKASEEAETALRKDWGPDYDVKFAEVSRLISKIGGQELTDALGDKGSNPIVVKALSSLAGMLSEDQVNTLKNVNTPAAGDETVEQAKGKIAEIEKPGSDDYKILHDENHLNHKNIVTERNRLYQIAYPTGGN